MKLFDFLKVYYEKTDDVFVETLTYEEKKVLNTPLLERRRGDTSGFQRKHRKKLIILDYILFTIIDIVLVILFIINDYQVIYLISLIVTILFESVSLSSSRFGIISIIYSYFLYNDESNIYKKILKDNFDGNKIYKDYRTIEEVFYKNGRHVSYSKKSLRKMTYFVLDSNNNLTKIIFKRDRIVYSNEECKEIYDSNKDISNDLYQEYINKIFENLLRKLFYIDKNTIDKNTNYKWVYVKEVKYKEKFRVYNKNIRLDKCNKYSSNKLYMINNIKCEKYYFKIGYKSYDIMVSKLESDNYIVFEKKKVEK